MRLELSDEQALFAEAIGRFVAQAWRYEDLRHDIARGAWTAAPLWRGLAEMGALALPVPEAADGLGGSAVDIGILCRALGHGLAIDPVRPAIEAAVLLAGAADTGAAELGEWLARAMAGEARLAVAADPSGARQVVPGGWQADALVALDGDAVLVIAGAAIETEPLRLLDDSVGARVTFDAAQATRHALADPALSGRARAMRAVCLLHDALGSAGAAFAQTVAHVQERRQFGRALSAFQVVEHKVAEMAVALQEIEAAALLAALVLDSHGPGAGADRACFSALTSATANARTLAETAVQLHGGMGVSDETPVAAHFRRLSAFSVHAGPILAATAPVLAHSPWRSSAVLPGA